MIDRLLEYLSEDLGSGDISTDSIIPIGTRAQAVIVSNEEGILAGIEETEGLLKHFKIEYETHKQDGDRIEKGERVMSLKGEVKTILELERLILNILGRMSGISTLTQEYASICEPYGVKVMATRKTTPGFRFFEKKAVEIGGGLPHRQGLYDGILIKDNHLAISGIKECVEKAKSKNPGMDVEVEVTTLDDAAEAISAGADIILVDNLSPEQAKEVIEGLRKSGLRDKIKIELSGGINRDNLEGYAGVGADRISMGSLTTDAKWLDLSMKILS